MLSRRRVITRMEGEAMGETVGIEDRDGTIIEEVQEAVVMGLRQPTGGIQWVIIDRRDHKMKFPIRKARAIPPMDIPFRTIQPFNFPSILGT